MQSLSGSSNIQSLSGPSNIQSLSGPSNIQSLCQVPATYNVCVKAGGSCLLTALHPSNTKMYLEDGSISRFDRLLHNGRLSY